MSSQNRGISVELGSVRKRGGARIDLQQAIAQYSWVHVDVQVRDLLESRFAN